MVIALVTSLIAAIGTYINDSWWNINWLTTVFGIIYLIAVLTLAAGLIRFVVNRSEQIIWGALLLIASLASIASIIFYLYKFDNLIFTTLTFALPILLFSLRSLNITPIGQVKSTIKQWPLMILYILSGAGLVYILLLNQIELAVRSPWQILTITPVILLAILTLSFAIASPSARSIWWLVGLSFISWSILIFAFPWPYGFDPWIHQATEKIISETGTITPKPFYYLGQYLPVVFLSKLLLISTEITDRWFLPILSAFGWSAATILFIKNIKPSISHPLLVAGAGLVFGWSMFTVTTPQNLANLWALMTIILLAVRLFGNKIHWLAIVLTSAATLFTHPLTGLPLFFLVAMFWLSERSSIVFKIMTWVSGTIAIFITPVAFVMFSRLGQSGASVIIENNFLSNLNILINSVWESLPMAGQYIDILDWVYLWKTLIDWSWFVLAGWGLIMVWKSFPKFKLFLVSFCLLTTSFLVMGSFLNFPNLPANEQSFYTDRLWDLSRLWLWPLVLLGLGHVISNWWQKGSSVKNIILISLVATLCATFYLNYPRLDLYNKNTGYNTTGADIEAVRLINQNANNAPYVVLANQAVSAAALHEFGFSHYYKSEFYYPLPTGTNPLYPIFLQATQTGVPSRAIVSQAHNFSGTPLVYLVLNEYWADFDKLTAIAQTESSAELMVKDGYIKIYRYDF